MRKMLKIILLLIFFVNTIKSTYFPGMPRIVKYRLKKSTTTKIVQ